MEKQQQRLAFGWLAPWSALQVRGQPALAEEEVENEIETNPQREYRNVEEDDKRVAAGHSNQDTV